MAWNIVFEPLFPLALILALALAATGLLAYSAFRRARGTPWRVAAATFLTLMLLNPTIRNEEREIVPDIAAIVVDRSQSLGNRIAPR